MDWKVFTAAFTTLFLAEMGDKTQLAAFTMAASTRKPWAVLAGGALALAAVTALGVAFGGVIGEKVPEAYVKKAAAVLFVAMGVWLWVKG